MFGLVGTVPDAHFPLISDIASHEGGQIVLGNERIAVKRGTPAMIAAAVETLKYMTASNPCCHLVGDIGNGDGCKLLYRRLAAHIGNHPPKTLALHYFQPDIALFKQLLLAIDALPIRPILIADAGFMYVAKMGGDAASFDLFTPDAGELAYLADEEAPHPFYTRGFILHEENLVPDLIKRAYLHKNAATYLLVKGETDYIADRSGVVATVDRPREEALEAIGGTGDTLTGIAAALIHAGMDLESASVNAARVNRLAGALARPNPATPVCDIIKQIPYALEQVLGSIEGG